jgi:flagellar M-ring protein FliF
VQQVFETWNALEIRKKFVFLLALAAALVSLAWMARLATAPSMALLYAGLEPAAATSLVQQLEQRGAVFEIRGDAIYVEKQGRDALRMALAGEGLPTNGTKGYELLEKITGFGTTSQMFDATYWRAIEGELARTILSAREVTSARVHIAAGNSTGFRRAVPPSASVVVATQSGALPAAQARALRLLVASAVAGLSPENVAIIDANGAVLGQDADAPLAGVDGRVAAYKDRVLRLIEARVGAGNAVVELAIEPVTETESLRETRFDPQGRVAISTETEETNSSDNNSTSAATVASNLPDGDTAAGARNSTNAQTRELVNYEVSQTERAIERTAGAIKRMTVAVLVNGITVQGADGNQTYQERPAEELAALTALVESAVGYDAARGDVITLKSMQFRETPETGTLGASSVLDLTQFDLTSLAQIAVLGLVTLGLGAFVIRPILASAADRPQALALPPVAANSTATTDALNGEIDDRPLTALAPNTEDTAEAVTRLRTLIGARQTETVEILRSWLEEDEEHVR